MYEAAHLTHHVYMTPADSGVIAQVDATLMIALMIEAKGISSTEGRGDHPWWHVIGVLSVSASLSVVLIGVMYDKPLSGTPLRVANYGLVIGFIPLLMTALDVLAPRTTGGIRKLILLLVGAAFLFWFETWKLSVIHTIW